MKTKMAIAVLAITFMSSLGFSKTINCSGKDLNGDAFKVSVAIDSNFKTSVSVQSSDYKNKWIADDVVISQRDGKTTIKASSGDRSEYFINLKVEEKGKSSLEYAEDDSGWELSLQPNVLDCK